MKRIIKLFSIIFVFIVLFSGMSLVNAHNMKQLKNGDKVCVDTKVFTKFYAYLWNGDNNNSWPGTLMTKEKDNDVYCYVADNDGYNNIIFNNGGNNDNDKKQTIDLSTLGDGLVYIFDENGKQSDNKYKGEWYVYDKSALVNLVNQAEQLDEMDYTYETYQKLLEVLNGDKGAKAVSEKPYNAEEMRIKLEDEKFFSTYEEVYNKLEEAIKNLKERHKIVIKKTDNGSLKVNYKDKSDTEIVITSSASTGYQLKSLKITKITGYDDKKPILDENSVELEINDDNIYNYTINNDIYIEPVYEKIIYHMTFKVDENGTIYDSSNEEIKAPVTVSYGDDYTLKIVANEGYDIDKVLVNGEEYEFQDGSVTINDIKNDIEVQITFQLKTYTVTIDEKEHKVSYGATYQDLLNLIDTKKEGYTFKGIKDQAGNFISEDYIVKGDIILTSVYEKDKIVVDTNQNNPNNKNDLNNQNNGSKLNNPNTGDNSFRNLLLLLISSCGILAIFIIKKTFIKIRR